MRNLLRRLGRSFVSALLNRVPVQAPLAPPTVPTGGTPRQYAGSEPNAAADDTPPSPFRPDGSIDELLVELVSSTSSITTRTTDTAGRLWRSESPLIPGEIQHVAADAVRLAEVVAARRELDAAIDALLPVVGLDTCNELLDLVNGFAVAANDAHADRLINLARSWLSFGQPVSAFVFSDAGPASEFLTGEPPVSVR